MKRAAMLIALTLSLAATTAAQQPVNLAVDLPREQRERFYNFTRPGSCVQCSNGALGLHQNVPEFEMLLWNSQYGPAEHGGSGPSRVARYARERNVRIYNVTGKYTWDWMKWACKTGRGASIGAGSNHMQALFGYDSATQTWYVWNNNTPKKIDAYNDAAFRRLHLASGQWCVILDYPPPAKPPVTTWNGWQQDIVIRK